VRPYVTLSLSGIGKGASAELSFGANAHVYDKNEQGSSSKTVAYTWTSDTTCQRYIGYYQSKTAANDTMTAAGTLIANELVLKDSAGNTYKVTMANAITIDSL
jgi:hypothetical protein